MNKSIIFRIVLALVLIGAMLGLGAFAFNAGLARGLAMSAPAAAGEPLQPSYGFYGMPYGRHFMGFGGKGDWSKGVPPMFDEWHQRAHEGQPKEGAEE